MIEMEPREDERGWLARSYCAEEFAKRGLNTHWPQCNVTLTRKKGMLRGMHYQADPKGEVKLLRCDGGKVFDVLVDVRRDSKTFGKWEGFELSGDGFRTLYIPTGIAHGFQCLEDDCRLFYQMGESFHTELARGIRWDDPKVNIRWPLANPIVSSRDAALPFL